MHAVSLLPRLSVRRVTRCTLHIASEAQATPVLLPDGPSLGSTTVADRGTNETPRFRHARAACCGGERLGTSAIRHPSAATRRRRSKRRVALPPGRHEPGGEHAAWHGHP